MFNENEYNSRLPVTSVGGMLGVSVTTTVPVIPSGGSVSFTPLVVVITPPVTPSNSEIVSSS